MSIVFSLLLIVGTYHGAFASSGQCSCEQTSKCDYSNRCDANITDCRKENVALGKNAKMSSVYNGGDGEAGPACLAVNGNRSHVLVPLNRSSPNCIHTSEKDTDNPFWEVDLNGTFTISDIIIYLRETKNVALGKKANMSSVYSGGDGMSGPACLAVNGNRRHVLVPLNRSSPNCIHTSEKDTENPFWEVDLNGTFTISDITIYLRETSKDHLSNAEIKVNEKRCYMFPGGNRNQVENIECTVPLRGQTVRVSKSVGMLVFCELEVWVCRGGLYGPSCEDRCSGHCRHKATCDNYNGTCHEGCEDGYYGDPCNKTCSTNCKNMKCDQTSGHCVEGCQSGWKGKTCDTICDSGTFGPDCKEHCGECKVPCHIVSGECHGGCEAGYTLPYCNTTCRNSRYGENCAQTCGHCADSEPCNITSGHCRECQEGHDLPFCKRHKMTSKVLGGLWHMDLMWTVMSYYQSTAKDLAAPGVDITDLTMI